MNEFVYQEMRIEKRPRLKGLADLMLSPGPVVKLGPPVMVPFAKSAIAPRIAQDLRVLRTRMQIDMPPIGGVMVRIGIHEAKTPDAEGKPRQRFLNANVVAAGRVPSLVVFRALPFLPRLQRAPAGWTSKSLYLWVTRQA